MTCGIKIPKMPWTQISGDLNPSQHGAIIAEGDGERLYLLEIQPVREYVGDDEAVEVGYPFWTKESRFDLSDLDPERGVVQEALRTLGADFLDDITPEQRALAIAESLHSHDESEEGQAGFAKDILGNRRVRWSCTKRAQGWRYLADEDREYRALVRGASK